MAPPIDCGRDDAPTAINWQPPFSGPIERIGAKGTALTYDIDAAATRYVPLRRDRKRCGEPDFPVDRAEAVRTEDADPRAFRDLRQLFLETLSIFADLREPRTEHDDGRNAFCRTRPHRLGNVGRPDGNDREIDRVRQCFDRGKAGNVTNPIVFRIDGEDFAGKAVFAERAEDGAANRLRPRRCPHHDDGGGCKERLHVSERGRRILWRACAGARVIGAAGGH